MSGNAFDFVPYDKGLVYKGPSDVSDIQRIEDMLGITIFNKTFVEYLKTCSCIFKNNDKKKEKLFGVAKDNNVLSIISNTLEFRQQKFGYEDVNNVNKYIVLSNDTINNYDAYILTDQNYIYFKYRLLRKIHPTNLTLDMFLYKFIIEGKTIYEILKKYNFHNIDQSL